VAPDVSLDPPAGNASATLADWLEARMLLGGDEEISREQIRRLLSAEPLDLSGHGDDVEQADVERLTRFDRRVDALLLEIERRSQVAPRIYPFRVEEQLVLREHVVGERAYLFLLWLSLQDAPFRDGRLDDVEEAFDDIARAALLVLVGPDGEARLFAQRYATDPATEAVRPTDFAEAIDWLRAHLKLAAGQGEVSSDAEADGDNSDSGEADDDRELPLRTYSDGGVDVVAWRHFLDGRSGFPVLLAQCTVQLKWRPKTRDVSLELWRSWIDFPTPPTKLLIIPFAIAESAKWWRDRNRLAGMILDRLRVCELLDRCGDEDLEGLNVMELDAWLREEVETYNAPDAAEEQQPKEVGASAAK
jgi:hypothetical protein